MKNAIYILKLKHQVKIKIYLTKRIGNIFHKKYQ